MNPCRNILLIGCLLGLAMPALSSSIEPMNLKDITQRAERIFEGRCIKAVHTVVKSRGGNDIPAVTYTFEVLDGLKGKISNRITIAHLSTFQDGRPFLADADKMGIQKYKPGNTYLLFLNGESYHGLSASMGLPQGVFDVRDGLAKNRAGNRYILTGFAEAVRGTAHAGWLSPQRMGKSADVDGVPSEQLKVLVRDLLSGKIDAPSRKEVR